MKLEMQEAVDQTTTESQTSLQKTINRAEGIPLLPQISSVKWLYSLGDTTPP